MKTKKSTIRYAAKQAYQLNLMRGIRSSTQVGLFCEVHCPVGYVKVHIPDNGFEYIHIPKSWVML